MTQVPKYEREKRKMKLKPEMKRTATILTISVLLVVSFLPVIYAPPLPIGDAGYPQANPFDSNPTAGTYSGVGTTTGVIGNAYDGDLDTSIAFGYGYDAAGYVEVHAFKKPSDNGLTDFGIKWLDIKVSYKASSNTASDDQYRIVAKVGAAETVLLDWVWGNNPTGINAKYDPGTGAQGHRTFSNVAEPDNGVWDWTDMTNLRAEVQTHVVGANNFQKVTLYEVWATVYSTPYPTSSTVSVQPSAVIGLHAGDLFYIDVYVTDVTNMWGYGILLNFSPSVLTALEYFSYGPFVASLPSEIGPDYVAVAYKTYDGDPTGFTGNTPMARIYFTVVADGTSVLTLSKYEVADVYGGLIALTPKNGIFASSAVRDVAVTDVTVDPINVVPGESVEIGAEVMNQGTVSETFDVTAFYDSNPISTQTVSDLAPGDSQILTSIWDTSGVSLGFHQIKVEATLAGDENPSNDVKLWDVVPEGVLVGRHDIAVTDVVRAYPTPDVAIPANVVLNVSRGDMVYINLTIENQGDFSETFNVTAVWSWQYGMGNLTDVSLDPGMKATLTFAWNTDITVPPWSFGGYDEWGDPIPSVGDIRVIAAPGWAGNTVYAEGVPYEKRLPFYDYTANNVFEDGKVKVSKPTPPTHGFILFDLIHYTDGIYAYHTWIHNLRARGYVVDTWNSGSITSSVLSQYDVFVIPQAHSSYSTEELSAIQSFVNDGGGLLVMGDDAPSIYTDLTGFAGIAWSYAGAYGGYTSDITPHPVTDGVKTAYFRGPHSVLYVTSPAQDLIRDSHGNIVLAVSEIGRGKVLGITDEDTIADWDIGNADNLRLSNNMIDWFVVQYEHELAVTLKAPQFLKPGDSVLLNATVSNLGVHNETSIALQLLIDDVVVNSALIPELLTGEIYTLSYLWTPTIKGTYNITAYAPPVPNEDFTGNNRISKSVTVMPPLIQPLEGQWANYSITLQQKGYGYNVAMVYLLNATYIKYISPYQMNVTLWIKDPVRGTTTGWMTLNIMNRLVENGIWAGMWYPLWIEPDVTVGSTANVLGGAGKVIGSRFVEIDGLLIDSWELEVNYYYLKYIFLFDKFTGVVTRVEAEDPYYIEVWKLEATNILRLLKLKVDPESGTVGTKVVLAGEEATPSGTVEIYWDKTLLGTTVADSVGDFSYTLTIPPSTRGTHYIRVIDLATHKPGAVAFKVLPSINVSPVSGPMGAKVQVTGLGFGANESVIVSFEDMRITEISADESGSFTAIFNIPLSHRGPYLIKAWHDKNYVQTTFTVTDVLPLDVNIDVGAVYFKGETVEFYAQTAFDGRPVDATFMNATLYKPDGTTKALTAQRIATGLCKIRYTISGTGSMTGTYTLVVEAGYSKSTVNAYGTSIKAFIVKPTWEREAPKMAAFSIASIGLVSAMILIWQKEKKKYV